MNINIKYVCAILLMLCLSGCGAGTDNDGEMADTSTQSDPGEAPLDEPNSPPSNDPSTTDPETPDDAMGEQSDGISLFGFLSVSDSVQDGYVSMSAEFITTDDPIPEEEISFLEEQLQPVAGSCRIGASSVSAQASFPVTGASDIKLNAGETIQLSSSGGTYAEMTRSEFDEERGYLYTYPARNLLRHSPNGITIDIPGNEFPVYTNTALPNIEPFELLAPVLPDTASPTTVFRWEGSGSEQDFVYIAIAAEE